MHCMFSTKERKSDNPVSLPFSPLIHHADDHLISQIPQLTNPQSCRWCNAVDYHHHEIGNFDIPLHIHCNRLGKKTCKYNLSLDPPELVVASVVKEANIADIPVVQSFVIVEKKMSQKERKRAQAKERAEAKSKA